MNYTEAARLSRQMSGGMTKTALEGWQRAGLGATGGGLLAYTMASLINPSMSRRGKILSTLAGMGTGAAAGYRFLPGYESGKTPAGTGNAGNAGTVTTDTSTTTTQAQAKAPAQTAAKTPAKTQIKEPVQTQAPAPAKAPVKTPAQTAAQTPAQEVAPAESLGSLGAAPAVEPAPAATPAPTPAPAPTATPATAPAAAPAAPAQEDDDVSGAVYRTLGGLGLGLGGAGLYAGNRALKNRRVRQFGARRQQVREDQDTYAAWNAALEELAHRPQVETPSVPAQAASQTATQAPAQTAAGGGKAPTMSVEDLRRKQDMEYRRRMRLDPDVLPDITHFDPAGYQLDKMGPKNAEKFLREISLGFNPSIPREVQLKALQSAFQRNANQGARYLPSVLAERLKEKAINNLKKDNPNFEAALEADVGKRGRNTALFNPDYIPIRLQNGKYSLRKISPYEKRDPLSARETDEFDRAVARSGTPDVWEAKQYGGRLVPSSDGKIYGWVPEMAPSDAPRTVRAARLARSVSAGSKVLSILLKALDN